MAALPPLATHLAMMIDPQNLQLLDQGVPQGVTEPDYLLSRTLIKDFPRAFVTQK